MDDYIKEDSKSSKKTKNLRQLNERYIKRMSLVKQGHEAKYKNDFIKAIKYYNSYIALLAEVKDIEVDEISPRHFDLKKDLAEMMLISHVYWEQSKILDRSPNLEKEFKKSLSKFLEFTVGLDYQVVNAEMLRKFIRKGRHVHKEEFKSAYARIYVESKKCYIATYCFGEEHPITEILRALKLSILKVPSGEIAIRSYYQISPHLIKYFTRFPLFGKIFSHFFARPILYMIAKIFYYYNEFSKK
ncbi:MAG: hypothetical protein HQK53_04125 [Oligoflexia bacterium]|nr:hypothetical protein [Oligoflexia bacterium]